MTTQPKHLVPVGERDERSAADRLWTLEQQEAIRRQLVPAVNGRPMAVSDADLALFGEVCARTGLDPFVRQVYLIPTQQGPRIHIGVDGHRLIAARAGLDSTDGPYWCGKDGAWTDVWLDEAPPVAAKYGVRRRGSRGTIFAVALYREFKGSGPNWTERPAHMLALVAERHALRKAFQAEFAGVARTVRDHGAELARQEPADEPEPEGWDEPRERLVDHETGELLEASFRDDADGGGAVPTREEALARYRDAARRARALRLAFEVPTRSASTGEVVDATVALEDRIAEAERAGVPVDRLQGGTPAGGR
jgi:hypothetical protein